MLAALMVAFAGCAKTPMQVQLGRPGSPLGPIYVHSGQLISLPHCCPPIELRDGDGKLVREFTYTSKPQPLVAGAGSYSIVGHDPAGAELVLRLEVKK